jgi:hypothetical protein
MPSILVGLMIRCKHNRNTWAEQNGRLISIKICGLPGTGFSSSDFDTGENDTGHQIID